MDGDLIACARYRIYDMRAKALLQFSSGLSHTTHVLFIIHLPVQAVQSSFVGFQGDPWVSCHIDELRRSSEGTLTLKVAQGGLQEKERLQQAEERAQGADERTKTLVERLQQAELRAQQAEKRAQRAEKRIQQEEKRVQQEKERVQQAEIRVQQAEERAQRAEERVKQEGERIRQEKERVRQAQMRVQQAEERAEMAEERVKQEGERIQQEKERVRQAQMRVQQAEERAEMAEKRVKQEGERIQQEKERVRQAQMRVRQAEERAEMAEERVKQEGERLQQENERVRQTEIRAEQAEKWAQRAEEGMQRAEERAQRAEKWVQQEGRKIQQEKKRARQAENRAQQAEERAQMAEERVQQAEERAQQAEERIQQDRETMEQRVQEAEARGDEMQGRLDGIERREQERLAVQEQAIAAEQGGASWEVKVEDLQMTGEVIGIGGWAEVRVAHLKVAAKNLHRQLTYDYYRQLFKREMAVAARVNHPNLLRFYGAKLEGGMTILTEFMPTSLRDQLERGQASPEHRLSRKHILSISVDVACALNYLHHFSPDPIIHRDLSSANVLLKPTPNGGWLAKVSDYGSANFQQVLQTKNPGSPVYAAPESQTPALQSPKMDIYSYGVLLIEMCTCNFPVPDHRPDLIRSIQYPRILALIRQCLNEDRNQRPTAAQVIDYLRTLQ